MHFRGISCPKMHFSRRSILNPTVLACSALPDCLADGEGASCSFPRNIAKPPLFGLYFWPFGFALLNSNFWLHWWVIAKKLDATISAWSFCVQYCVSQRQQSLSCIIWSFQNEVIYSIKEGCFNFDRDWLWHHIDIVTMVMHHQHHYS